MLMTPTESTSIDRSASDAELSPSPNLRRLLAERDRLSKGCYYGLHEMRLKDAEPTRYERFHSALRVGLFSAREVSKFVSASPGSREMGELLFGLLTPEGDPVGISQGLAGNIACFPIGVRWMINNGYEDNPGIHEGDIFSGDDPQTMGAIHPGDCFTYLPIFYSGRLVAWAAGMNHIIDVGSMIGGSWPPFSQDTFTDGFVVPLTKTGEHYEYHAWWLEMWKRRTRAAVFNILDEKMRLSGCQMIERKVHEVIAEFGLEYFIEGTREIIEDGRRAVRRNVRELAVPGRARNATFRAAGYSGVGVLFPLAAREYLIHVPVESRVDGDAGLIIDTAGASPWGFHSYNGYKGGLAGAVYLSAMDGYAHNTKISQGLMEHVQVGADLGSVLNPDYEHASASNPWATTVSVISCSISNASRGFQARGYLEECWTGEASWDGVQGSGILPNGKGWGFTNLQYVGASGMGAFCYKDGLPTVWTNWNHRSDIGNAEEWEYVTPALYYLGRRLVPEYCGHGKYRGAIGHSAAYVILNPGRLAINRGGGTGARNTVIANGMCGGYPAPGVFIKTLHGTNMRELMERGDPYPSSPWELDEFVASGRLKAARSTAWKQDFPPHEMKDGDLYAQAAGAGGGWGDPIERDPALVLDDVQNDWIDRDTAREVYGVIVAGNGRAATLDEAATVAQRKALRARRLSRGVPVKEWWKATRPRVLAGEFIEPVRSMHRDCLRFEHYRDEFTGFWALDATFAYIEEDAA
jgi:acetone carboxylase alpha subunit